MSIRIGFNGHLAPRGRTYRAAGVAEYEKQLMSRLPQVDADGDYVFFTPRGQHGAHLRTSRLPTWNPLVRIAWEQTALPVSARLRHLDVLHSPVNVSPLMLPGVASVVTIHDLAFRRFPDTFVSSKRAYLDMMVRTSARRAQRVITPSETTRSDVIQAFGVSPEIVVAIPLGVDEHYRRTDGLAAPIEGPFILYVGTIEPRKNLTRLVYAYTALKRLGYPHRLALVGPLGWKYDEVLASIAASPFRESICMPGYCDDLLPWYNSADLFVYPSVYEGFGLPPLEAMACGAPVVTSSSGSLREIVGDAAVVTDLAGEHGLEIAMRSVLDDPELAVRLREQGLRRAAGFSWTETARKTASVYRDVVGESS